MSILQHMFFSSWHQMKTAYWASCPESKVWMDLDVILRACTLSERRSSFTTHKKLGRICIQEYTAQHLSRGFQWPSKGSYVQLLSLPLNWGESYGISAGHHQGAIHHPVHDLFDQTGGTSCKYCERNCKCMAKIEILYATCWYRLHQCFQNHHHFNGCFVRFVQYLMILTFQQCRRAGIFVTVSPWNQPFTFHPQESCQATQTRPCLAARTSGASSYCNRPFSSNGLRVSELTLFLAVASANSHPLGRSFHQTQKNQADSIVPGWGPWCPCAAAHTRVLLSTIPEHDQLPHSCPLLVEQLMPTCPWNYKTFITDEIYL